MFADTKSPSPNTTDITKWNCNDVLDWLESFLPVQKYLHCSAAFKQNSIDGDTLIRLHDGQLEQLGIDDILLRRRLQVQLDVLCGGHRPQSPSKTDTDGDDGSVSETLKVSAQPNQILSNQENGSHHNYQPSQRRATLPVQRTGSGHLTMQTSLHQRHVSPMLPPPPQELARMRSQSSVITDRASVSTTQNRVIPPPPPPGSRAAARKQRRYTQPVQATAAALERFHKTRGSGTFVPAQANHTRARSNSTNADDMLLSRLKRYLIAGVPARSQDMPRSENRAPTSTSNQHHHRRRSHHRNASQVPFTEERWNTFMRNAARAETSGNPVETASRYRHHHRSQTIASFQNLRRHEKTVEAAGNIDWHELAKASVAAKTNATSTPNATARRRMPSVLFIDEEPEEASPQDTASNAYSRVRVVDETPPPPPPQVSRRRTLPPPVPTLPANYGQHAAHTRGRSVSALSSAASRSSGAGGAFPSPSPPPPPPPPRQFGAPVAFNLNDDADVPPPPPPPPSQQTRVQRVGTVYGSHSDIGIDRKHEFDAPLNGHTSTMSQSVSQSTDEDICHNGSAGAEGSLDANDRVHVVPISKRENRDRPVLKGTLEKRSRPNKLGISRWQKRHFILTMDALVYYKSSASRYAAGSIPICDIDSVQFARHARTLTKKDDGRRFDVLMRIQRGSKQREVYPLRCDSAANAEKWLQAISQQVQEAQRAMPVRLSSPRAAVQHLNATPFVGGDSVVMSEPQMNDNGTISSMFSASTSAHRRATLPLSFSSRFQTGAAEPINDMPEPDTFIEGKCLQVFQNAFVAYCSMVNFVHEHVAQIEPQMLLEALVEAHSIYMSDKLPEDVQTSFLAEDTLNHKLVEWSLSASGWTAISVFLQSTADSENVHILLRSLYITTVLRLNRFCNGKPVVFESHHQRVHVSRERSSRRIAGLDASAIISGLTTSTSSDIGKGFASPDMGMFTPVHLNPTNLYESSSGVVIAINICSQQLAEAVGEMSHPMLACEALMNMLVVHPTEFASNPTGRSKTFFNTPVHCPFAWEATFTSLAACSVVRRRVHLEHINQLIVMNESNTKQLVCFSNWRVWLASILQDVDLDIGIQAVSRASSPSPFDVERSRGSSFASSTTGLNRLAKSHSTVSRASTVGIGKRMQLSQSKRSLGSETMYGTMRGNVFVAAPEVLTDPREYEAQDLIYRYSVNIFTQLLQIIAQNLPDIRLLRPFIDRNTNTDSNESDDTDDTVDGKNNSVWPVIPNTIAPAALLGDSLNMILRGIQLEHPQRCEYLMRQILLSTVKKLCALRSIDTEPLVQRNIIALAPIVQQFIFASSELATTRFGDDSGIGLHLSTLSPSVSSYSDDTNVPPPLPDSELCEITSKLLQHADPMRHVFSVQRQLRERGSLHTFMENYDHSFDDVEAAIVLRLRDECVFFVQASQFFRLCAERVPSHGELEQFVAGDVNQRSEVLMSLMY
jgi:PH domain/SAM domain (Sterile alpha motif)